MPLLLGLIVAPGLLKTGNVDAQTQPPSAMLPGTKVSLTPPPGFTPASQFAGYIQEESNASILVTEMPAPVKELAAGLTSANALQQRGLILLSQEKVTVNGQQGLLLQVQQRAFEQEFRKWILLLGNDTASVLLTATYPLEKEPQLSQPLKQALLTARWESEKAVSLTEGLTFALQGNGSLQPARRVSNALIFTKDGSFPSQDLNDPIFVIAPSVAELLIANPEEFARNRLQSTASVSEIQLQSSNEIKINNLTGYEMIAQGVDQNSKQPVTIYQVMLFDGFTYYLMQGLVSSSAFQEYLPNFQAIARSFQRTPTEAK